MNMYSLIEYSDNYEDPTASLYQFKRQEPVANNGDLTDASTSFDYKSKLLANPSNLVDNALPANANPEWKDAKIIVPLKYVSSFFRSLKLPLINTKLNIQLNYTKNSVISDNAGATTFKITKATELYVPVVTLKTEDNNKLNLLSDDEFKREVYWNEYKSKIEDVIQLHNNNNFKRTLFDAVVPGINRLFVIGFNDNVENLVGNNVPADNTNRV